jgi:hypothetical protein
LVEKLRSSVADPGSGVFLTPRSGIGKKSRTGSEMNIPDHISKELRKICWVKNIRNTAAKLH